MRPIQKRLIFGVLALTLLLLVLNACGGPWMHGGVHGGRGYGSYDDRRPPVDSRYRNDVPVRSWGPVTGEDQAAGLVREMLLESRNPNLKIGKVTDKGPFFEVEILTRSDALVDIMQVDKESGQMRSAYR